MRTKVLPEEPSRGFHDWYLKDVANQPADDRDVCPRNCDTLTNEDRQLLGRLCDPKTRRQKPEDRQVPCEAASFPFGRQAQREGSRESTRCKYRLLCTAALLAHGRVCQFRLGSSCPRQNKRGRGSWSLRTSRGRSDAFVGRARSLRGRPGIVEPESGAGQARRATRTSTTTRLLILTKRLDHLICEVPAGSQKPTTNPTSWLIVRRLLGYLLREEERELPEDPRKAGVMLVGAREAYLAPLHVAKVREAQFGFYLDPIVHGILLLDKQMVSSLKLACAVATPTYSQPRYRCQGFTPNHSQARPYRKHPARRRGIGRKYVRRDDDGGGKGSQRTDQLRQLDRDQTGRRCSR